MGRSERNGKGGRGGCDVTLAEPGLANQEPLRAVGHPVPSDHMAIQVRTCPTQAEHMQGGNGKKPCYNEHFFHHFFLSVSLSLKLTHFALSLTLLLSYSLTLLLTFSLSLSLLLFCIQGQRVRRTQFASLAQQDPSPTTQVR